MTRQHTISESRSRDAAVSVIIPTYNERQNVVPIVEACLDALQSYDPEVVVVDDDSPDETWKLARQTFANEDRVRVIRRTDEHGLATAVVTGFDAAENDLLAVIDADFQHPAERLPDLADAILNTEATIAIGSRFRPGGGIENWSTRRRIVSRCAAELARLFVPESKETTDPMSGFFAVDRSVIDGVELSPTGYKILLEILSECHVEHVVEVPYTFSDRKQGESKAGVFEYARFVNHVASCWLRSQVQHTDRGATPLAGD